MLEEQLRHANVTIRFPLPRHALYTLPETCGKPADKNKSVMMCHFRLPRSEHFFLISNIVSLFIELMLSNISKSHLANDDSYA